MKFPWIACADGLVDEISESLPKARESTSGWASWWGWWAVQVAVATIAFH